MAKITLEINDKNLPTVLNILENLKKDLISNISVNAQSKIKPVSSSISGENTKRYLSKDKYKQKLNQRVEKDEFLDKSTSTGKYLSPADFRNKLKGK